MNKKLILLGAFILTAGFFALTAFDGKTLEQQKAEIAQTVTMKLDELRAAKEQECTDRIDVEAQRRFDEIVVAREAEAAKTGKKPSSGKKSSSSKGSKTDPAPQKSGTGSESKDKWNSGQTQGSQDKWNKPQGDQTQPAQPSESKSKWTKPAGGGN